MTNSNLIQQRRTLLKAVKVLADNGHIDLAEQVWASTVGRQSRVLLPGEPDQ